MCCIAIGVSVLSSTLPVANLNSTVIANATTIEQSEEVVLSNYFNAIIANDYEKAATVLPDESMDKRAQIKDLKLIKKLNKCNLSEFKILEKLYDNSEECKFKVELTYTNGAVEISPALLVKKDGKYYLSKLLEDVEVVKEGLEIPSIDDIKTNTQLATFSGSAENNSADGNIPIYSDTFSAPSKSSVMVNYQVWGTMKFTIVKKGWASDTAVSETETVYRTDGNGETVDLYRKSGKQFRNVCLRATGNCYAFGEIYA